MSDYKPLTDEELESAKLGAQQWNQGLLGLIEQARRANALVKTVYRCSPTCICPKCKALAAYLGETND